MFLFNNLLAAVFAALGYRVDDGIDYSDPESIWDDFFAGDAQRSKPPLKQLCFKGGCIWIRDPKCFGHHSVATQMHPLLEHDAFRRPCWSLISSFPGSHCGAKHAHRELELCKSWEVEGSSHQGHAIRRSLLDQFGFGGSLFGFHGDPNSGRHTG